MIDFNELPPCTHGPHEAKAVFVGTGRCALCLTDQIESLQRENEELKGRVSSLSILSRGMVQPAITPEMRERIREYLAPFRDADRGMFPGVDILRDLLGEQG